MYRLWDSGRLLNIWLQFPHRKLGTVIVPASSGCKLDNYPDGEINSMWLQEDEHFSCLRNWEGLLGRGDKGQGSWRVRRNWKLPYRPPFLLWISFEPWPLFYLSLYYVSIHLGKSAAKTNLSYWTFFTLMSNIVANILHVLMQQNANSNPVTRKLRHWKFKSFAQGPQLMSPVLVVCLIWRKANFLAP